MSSKPDPFERPTEFSTWPEAPYHPRFIEKLLLAIIDAYPSEVLSEGEDLEKQRQRRLRAAIKALFGRSPRTGPINANDLLALAEMTKEAMLNRTMATLFGSAEIDQSTIPGDRELARKRGHPRDSNAEDRLRRAFRKHRDYFQSIGTNEVHLEEEEMLRDLSDVHTTLQRYNVALNIDTEKLGMLSFVVRRLPRSGA